MTTNRIRSLELKKDLQPLSQGGIITAAQSKVIITQYANNNISELQKLCLNPKIPMSWEPVLEKLRQYL